MKQFIHYFMLLTVNIEMKITQEINTTKTLNVY